MTRAAWATVLPRHGRWADVPAAVAWCQALLREQGVASGDAGWLEALHAARETLEAMPETERAAALAPYRGGAA